MRITNHRQPHPAKEALSSPLPPPPSPLRCRRRRRYIRLHLLFRRTAAPATTVAASVADTVAGVTFASTSFAPALPLPPPPSLPPPPLPPLALRCYSHCSLYCIGFLQLLASILFCVFAILHLYPLVRNSTRRFTFFLIITQTQTVFI